MQLVLALTLKLGSFPDPDLGGRPKCEDEGDPPEPAFDPPGAPGPLAADMEGL